MDRIEGNDLTLMSRYLFPAPCDHCEINLDLHDWVILNDEGYVIDCDRRDNPHDVGHETLQARDTTTP